MTSDWRVLAWEAVGILGALIFCGRFYLQLWASERRKKSVVPIGFWYMSSVGSLTILPYAAFYLGSPVGALSHCFNVVIYARNLRHIWQERGNLSRRRYWLLHGAAAVIVFTAVLLVACTWLGEYQSNRAAPVEEARRTWAWIAVGLVGQGLFGCRFFVQWAVTEARRQSVIPLVFWYVSLAAAILLGASYLNRPTPEWILALTVAAPIPVYLRNLWLIHCRHVALPTP